MRWPVLLSMLLAACAAPTGRLSKPEVPPPATVAVVETHFGIASADPYRWMEDPAREAEMVAWVRAMSAASTAQLQALPDRAAFASLLEESSRAGTRYSDVTSAAGRLFYRRLTPGDRVPSLVVREGTTERVLIDPTAGTAEVAAINNYTVSPDGDVVAVHIAKGGGEVGEVRFIEVTSGSQRGSPLGPIWGEFAVSWIAPDLISYTRITASVRDRPHAGYADLAGEAGRSRPRTSRAGQECRGQSGLPRAGVSDPVKDAHQCAGPRPRRRRARRRSPARCSSRRRRGGQERVARDRSLRR